MTNKKNSFTRGSEWRKWDLHIHSDCSPRSPEQIVDKLIEKRISVFSITDHSSVENINKFLEIVGKKQKENKKIYFLPGIELKTDKGKRSVHLIGIFPLKDKEGNKIDLDFLKQNLLSKIDCSDSDIIRAGKKELGRGKNPSEYRKRGLLEISVNFELAAKKIRELGGITIVHAGMKASGLEKEMHHARTNSDQELYNSLGHTKRDLMEKYIDVCELPNWNESSLKERDFYLKEFNKPSIVSSDSHSLSNIGGKFTWIKADPVYNGLKQILYEPDSGERAFIGESPPTHKNLSKVIDRIEVKNSNNWFSTEPILLNENLISIIGEKGSGKTALADFIAFAGGDFSLDKEDLSSFINKAVIPTKQITDTIVGCKIVLNWKNGKPDIIDIDKDFTHYRPIKKVKYLSQSFIEKRCCPENFGELQRDIENIIFQHITTSDRIGETTFWGLRKRKTESIEVRKAERRRDILELNESIFSLEEEILSLETKKKDKAKLEQEQRELEAQKPKPATKKEKEIEKILSLLNDHENSLENKIAELKSHLTTIDSIKTKTSTMKAYVKKQLSKIKDDLKNIGLSYEKLEFSIIPDFLPALEKKSKEIDKQINKFKGVAEAEDKKEKELKLNELKKDMIEKLTLNKTRKCIKEFESDSSIVESTREVIKDYESKITKIKAGVKKLDENINDIETVKKPELPDKLKLRKDIYDQYFKLLKEEKKSLEELYAPLKEEAKTGSLMEFFARIEFDVEGFFNKAKAVLDFVRKGSYRRGEGDLFKRIKDISEAIELGEIEDIAGEMEKFYSTFEKNNEGEEFDIQSQLRKEKKMIDFYNWFFDTTDFKVAYNIKYQGTSLELLSPGKKGVVLLLMYLVLDTEGSVPLIIDQPEENLDNKSVFPSLVNYFRRLKRRRQVLIITHNPNLVLNTDAEQIIVANFDAVSSSQPSRISYVSGAIENSFVSKEAKIPLEKRGIRDHSLEILEGGKTALDKRVKKWGSK
jgi:hypothetical protein